MKKQLRDERMCCCWMKGCMDQMEDQMMLKKEFAFLGEKW